MDPTSTYAEIDCPWFSLDWLAEHPDFPIASPTTTKE